MAIVTRCDRCESEDRVTDVIVKFGSLNYRGNVVDLCHSCSTGLQSYLTGDSCLEEEVPKIPEIHLGVGCKCGHANQFHENYQGPCKGSFGSDGDCNCQEFKQE